MSAADSAGVRFPPPAIFAISLLAGALLDRVWPLAPPPGAWRTIAGAALLLAGVALDVAAIAPMARRGTTLLPWGRASALVTSGPFRFSRNPIYMGYAIECVGIALVIGSWWALLLFVAAVYVVDAYVIPREEAHLRAVFGDEYAHYQARVRRWL